MLDLNTVSLLEQLDFYQHLLRIGEATEDTDNFLYHPAFTVHDTDQVLFNICHDFVLGKQMGLSVNRAGSLMQGSTYVYAGSGLIDPPELSAFLFGQFVHRYHQVPLSDITTVTPKQLFMSRVWLALTLTVNFTNVLNVTQSVLNATLMKDWSSVQRMLQTNGFLASPSISLSFDSQVEV
jgi:hypothetical protein